MRRIVTASTFAFLGLGVVPASAQAPAPPVPAVVVTSSPGAASTLFRRAVTPAAVIDRLLSFDADGDDRVTAAELPERMQSLVDRLDQDDDGFMTASEIEAAVDGRSAFVAGLNIVRNRTPTLSDVVHDLKLPQPKHDRALAIVKNYQVPRNLNNSKSIDLEAVHAAMKDLLDEEELGDFLAAAARLRPGSITFIDTVVR